MCIRSEILCARHARHVGADKPLWGQAWRTILHSRRPFLVCAIASCLLALASVTCLAQTEVGKSQAELMNATVTTARPEVGTFGFCTGTLILPQYVITASHCFDHFSQIYSPSSRPSFSIDQEDGTRTSYPVDRVFSFGYPLGSYDVALVRLTRPVPPTTATPAPIHPTGPREGTVVTVMGYGCTTPDAGSDGRKRSRVTRLSFDENRSWTTRNTLCPGDSGGPMFAGEGSNARLLGVNSQSLGSPPNQADVYGQLPRIRSEIFRVVLAWQIRGTGDLSNIDWCTGDAKRSYNADVNADRQLDAICHDERTGRIDVAVGNARVIKPNFTYPSAFCVGEGNELHLGDFNEDRRTDLLCVHRNDGNQVVLFATNTGTYSERNRYDGRTRFCTHTGSEIHTGDFNGDGRTDMLCHDRNNGRKWIDYASADTRSLFGGSDWSTSTNWCSHRGAQLHVSDFNRDRRSDLLCHTRPNGSIDVKLYREGTVFSHNMDFQQTEARFCTDAEDTLTTWDLVGSGRADLVCIDKDGDGGAEVISSRSDEIPFIINPSTQSPHWTRVSYGRNAVRQWYLTETGVANQPDQRDHQRVHPEAGFTRPRGRTLSEALRPVLNLCPSILVAGDRDFGGHGPFVTGLVTLSISRDGTRLESRVTFRARETTSDWSEVSGEWTLPVGEPAPTGMRYARIESPTTSRFSQTLVGGGRNEVFEGCDGAEHVITPTGGPVSRIVIVGDTGGADISDDRNCHCDTRIVRIEFRPVDVTLSPR